MYFFARQTASTTLTSAVSHENSAAIAARLGWTEIKKEQFLALQPERPPAYAGARDSRTAQGIEELNRTKRYPYHCDRPAVSDRYPRNQPAGGCRRR